MAKEGKRFEFTWQGKKLTWEIDQLANQSEKSVLGRYGNTVVLTVLCLKKNPEAQFLDFTPLTVFFEEKFYSIGKIPAVFHKRESKPDYHSTTVARLIDRSLRGFFLPNNQWEIQITNTVLAFDPADDPRVLACWNSLLACYLSSQLVSFNQPLASIILSKEKEQVIYNPSQEQLSQSDFELIVTASRDKIVMLELRAPEMEEKELVSLVKQAQEVILSILDFFEQIARSFLKKPKPSSFSSLASEQIAQDPEMVKTLASVLAAKESWTNKEEKLEELWKRWQVENPDHPQSARVWNSSLKEEIEKHFQQTQRRVDGRKPEDIRPLSIKINYLPQVHGSALFQRGKTQVLSVITLGKSSERQLIDNTFTHHYKHFIHHYNFPAFAVNEIAGFKSLSRREIGHGQLVEKSFVSLLPNFKDFPYTIRVVSEVLSSDGSSSQASICATSLALTSAGVPFQKLVAGIALGLLGGEILVDVNAWEDKLGKMDCKIAGSEKGVCSLQLETKEEGISLWIFQQTLAQGRKARLSLLKEMKQTLAKIPRSLPSQIVKFKKIFLGTENFGLVVGAQGRTINRLTEETGVSLDLQPDGFLLFYYQQEEQLEQALNFLESKVKKLNFSWKKKW